MCSTLDESVPDGDISIDGEECSSPRSGFEELLAKLSSPKLSQTLDQRLVIQELLQSACRDFKFDIGILRDVTNDHALLTLGMYILTVDTKIVTELGLDPRALCSFLLDIEGQYAPHPYHNKNHAADVLQVDDACFF